MSCRSFCLAEKERKTFINWLPLLMGGAMHIKIPCASEFPIHTCQERQDKMLWGGICMKLIEAGMEGVTSEQSEIESVHKTYLVLLELSRRI